MTGALAIALTGLLAAISLLHVAWALGLRWPGTDEASLALRVIGRTPGGRMPSRSLTIAVAAAIMTGAALVVVVSAADLSGAAALPARVGYIGLTAVFAARGLAGYIPAVWRRSERTPFHRLNRLFYSPLCLLIAAGLCFNLLLR